MALEFARGGKGGPASWENNLKRQCVAWTVACLCCWALPAMGQEWARKMFDTTSHDFGTVPRGAKAEFRFTITNLYKEDVHILSVRSSCGCTKPRIENESLKTWEKGYIVAAFDTRAFLGQRRATLTVTFDKPFFAQTQLHVTGFIRGDIVIDPGAVQFGSVDQGVPASTTVQVRYAGRPDWQIVEVRSANPHLTAEIAETSRGGGEVSYALTVHLAPDAPVGYLREQLRLVTNDRRTPEVLVDVEGRVVAELTVSPATLFLGVLQPGQTVHKKLVVQAHGPIRVTTVEADSGSFEFHLPEAAKPVQLVGVTYTAPDRPGKVSYTLRILTDLGGGTARELAAYAQVVEPSGGQADLDDE